MAKRIHNPIAAALVLASVALVASPAEAGIFRHRRRAACGEMPTAPATAPMQPAYSGPQAAPTAPPQMTAPVPVVAASYAGPATGATASDFLAMLNAERAARGLAPLAYDPGLEAGAARNNAACAGRGMGHWIMSNAGQCAAMARDSATALAMWAASGAHAAILFDPSARTCGFACGGGYATANVGR